VTHWCSLARSISPSRAGATSSIAPATSSSAAAFGSPWAAHSEHFRATATYWPALHHHCEALRPLRRVSSSLHRSPDARRHPSPPPPPLSSSVTSNPKCILPIDSITTIPTSHWSSCAGSLPTLAAGASPSIVTSLPPPRVLVEIHSSDHHSPRHGVHLNRRELLKPPLPSDHAAGDPLRRNMAVPSPLPFCL
jgi:hypothetical protein